MMKIEIATLFPEMCERVVDESIIGRARRAGKLEISCVNIRDYSDDKFKRVDDSPYGGGMGRLREVCGAVSGAVMVISLLTGLDTLVPEEKKELYALERQVAERFKERAGSYICRDLIAVHPHGDTHNSHKPACRELVGLAVEILEEIKITEYRK